MSNVTMQIWANIAFFSALLVAATVVYWRASGKLEALKPPLTLDKPTYTAEEVAQILKTTNTKVVVPKAS